MAGGDSRTNASNERRWMRDWRWEWCCCQDKWIKVWYWREYVSN